MYVLLDLFTLAGFVGLAVGMWRRTLPRLLALQVLWLVLIMLSLVRWTWLTMASQGRLIFPAIAAVAILIVYGLEQIRIRGALLAMVLFVFAALAPFVLIAPAYALPQRFIGNAPIFNSLDVTFDNTAELVGYSMPQSSIKPGGELPITIYWRARAPMAEDFSVSLVLFDSGENIVARWRAFPGNGMYPTASGNPVKSSPTSIVFR